MYSIVPSNLQKIPFYVLGGSPLQNMRVARAPPILVRKIPLLSESASTSTL
jgi:hypothetical protein